MPFTYEYPRPAVTVDAVIFRTISGCKTEVLLIKRKYDPYKGYWAFPGGFIEMDETLEEAIIHELGEETSLTGIELHQFKAYSKVDRDPRGRTISVVFYGAASKDAEVHAKDDAILAQWFPIYELPQLAFDHQQIFDELSKKLLSFPVRE